jgi:hypothetical protein
MSTPKSYRYQFEKKGSQHPCPACGKRREFTRYIDTKTGDLLPEAFGRCNRADRCGHDQSPYQPDERGRVYADEVRAYEREQWKAEQTGNRSKSASRPASRPAHYSYPAMSKPEPAPTIYTIPDEVFSRSLAHYDRNNFAALLTKHFGAGAARDLLERFHLGTSAHWPGACVFWLIDEADRARGGQVVLFGEDGHTARYTDHEGNPKRATTWVHTALTRTYRHQSAPPWLTGYADHAPKFPILFGLPQLRTAPADYPVAIVEAPATAVFCSGYFPAFLWLAVGALDWLNAERLASVKSRKIRLFPDLSETGTACQKWTAAAERLQAVGFSVEVDTLLEQQASPKERTNKYDLRDYLLEQWPGYPPEWDFLTI